jgi:hypothetical protein
MANPKTTNLGLDLIDRSAPASTYLNLQTNLDDNWVKIDQQLGVQILDKHAAPIPIAAGAQVVQGGNAPAIAGVEVDGRTWVNLLGDYGNFETATNGLATGWQTSYPHGTNACINELVSSPVMFGSKAQRVFRPSSSASGGGAYLRYPIQLAPGNYLFAIWLRRTVGNSVALEIGNSSSFANTITGNYAHKTVSPGTSFALVHVKFNNPTNQVVYIKIGNGAGAGTDQEVIADGALLAELSAAEYTALDTMTPDQIAAKYPYVGTGIHGITNPTIEVVQDNMLPPFNEWTLSGTGVISEPYKMSMASSSSEYYVPCLPNTTYTLSMTITGGRFVIQQATSPNTSSLISGSTFDKSTSGSITITTGATARYFRVSVDMNSGSGTFTFSNPKLELGSVATPFKPQSNSRMTALTTLRSTPDGSVKDKLEWVDGKAKKVKRLVHVVLDGSLAWVLGGDQTGFKRVAFTLSGVIPSSVLVTKYDGKQLASGSTSTAADYAAHDGTSTMYLSVADSDSGWGESYTPTAEEIKAYFNGWKMNNGTFGTPFNGTGTKTWVAWNASNNNFPNTTMPTTVAALWNPYQLQYQLATPKLEDVYTQGYAVVERGDNYINVSGSGAPIVTAELSFADTHYSALKDVAAAVSALSRPKGFTYLNPLDKTVPNNGAFTMLYFKTAQYDKLGEQVQTRQNAFRAASKGIYLISGHLTVSNVQDGQRMAARLYKNGVSNINIGALNAPITSDNGFPLLGTMWLNEGDTLDIYVLLVNGTAGTIVLSDYSWVSFAKLTD